MGLPLPPTTPQITVNGRTYGAGACNWLTPDGANYIGGVYELTAQGWNFVASPNNIVIYLNPGEMPADVKAKGGSVSYCAWFDAQINAAFAKLFGSAPPAPTEPTTDDQAMAMLQAHLATKKLVLVNGIPTLQ